MTLLTEYEIIVLSLSAKVAFASTIIIFIPALFVSYILAMKKFIGKTFLDSFVHLPLVLPPVVIGFILLMIFGRNGFLGGHISNILGYSISFTWIAATIASAVMAFPLFVRSIRQSFESVDKKILLAAESLGASQIKVFITILIPLSKNGIVSGFILSFSRSLGEFGATITFAGNIFGETQTIPLAIYSSIQDPDAGIILLRLVIISIVFSFLALIFSNRLSND